MLEIITNFSNLQVRIKTLRELILLPKGERAVEELAVASYLLDYPS